MNAIKRFQAAATLGLSVLRTRSMTGMLSAVTLCLTLLPSGRPLSAQTATTPAPSPIPAVVVTSVSAFPATGLKNPEEVTIDSCGNVYDEDDKNTGSANLLRIPAAGGAATLVHTTTNGYNIHLGQDESRGNIYVSDPYDSFLYQIPLNACIPNSNGLEKVPSTSHVVPGALGNYFDVVQNTVDFNGNVFFGTDFGGTSGSSLVLISNGGTASILLNSLPNEILSIAIDKNENLYYITENASNANTVYELLFTPTAGQTDTSVGTYSTTPVVYGGSYVDPIALSVDPAGNLYIVDQGGTVTTPTRMTIPPTLYEIPFVVTTPATSTTSAIGTLVAADQYVVESGQSPQSEVAVDPKGRIFFIDGSTSIKVLSLGNSNFGTVAVGTSSTNTLNFQFNASTTPTTITLPTGVFSNTSSSTCTAGTVYAAGSSCTITLTFTPTAVGQQTSVVVLGDANGNTIATGYLTGVGQGPALTVDPGTVASIGSGLKTPAGIAVDAAGDVYIADSANNSVTEFPVGGGAPVPVNVPVIATTDLPLSGPMGVAVDAVGDIFIADTGNYRVIEIPSISGAPSTASPIVIASGLGGSATTTGTIAPGPSSVFVDATGDLYITDTGGNTVILYPNTGTGLGSPTYYGVTLLNPLSAVVDSSGSLDIADSGNNQIVRYPVGGSQEIVAAGILNPSALATDASDSLFVVDQGNDRILRIPSIGGVLNPNDAIEVGLGVALPYGLAIDGSANLYVTDSTNAAAYSIARTQTAVDFGSSAVGVASAALPSSVESEGNLPVIFNTPFYTGTGNSGDFAMTSPTGTCAAGATLAPGLSCDLADTFTPTATGARSATLVFSSNATQATPAQVVLTGSGITLTTTTTKLAITAPANGAPFFGEPTSFTATVTGGTPAPTGVVAFVIDNVQVGLLPLVSGVATLNLNSGITGGTHVIYAVYKGDSANNGSATPALTLVVPPAPTTTAILPTTIAFNNPYTIRRSNPGSCTTTVSGQQYTFPPLVADTLALSAQVASVGIGIPTGTLTFYSNGSILQILTSTVVTTTDPTTGKMTTNTVLSYTPAVIPIAPVSGGGFGGSITLDADLLYESNLVSTPVYGSPLPASADPIAVGENGVLLDGHAITVVYSGDQNYLMSTSPIFSVTVTNVGPTTPVSLPGCDNSDPSTDDTSLPSSPASLQIQPSSPTVTATAATPGLLNVTVSSLGGYNGVIDITCVGLPAYAQCSTNPGQATILPSTVSSPLPPSVIAITISVNNAPYVPTAAQSSLFWFVAALFGLGTLTLRRRFAAQMKGRLFLFFGAAVLMGASLAGLSGCGSGTSSSGAVTPTGTSTVTVNVLAAQFYSVNGNQVPNPTPDLLYTFPVSLTVK